MSDCPFCDRIEAGKFDGSVRLGCVTFEPLNPVTPGHRLVVPVEHYERADRDPQRTGCAFAYAAELARVADLAAFNLITSAGAPATQTVRHLHVHLIPRQEGDGLYLPWTGQRAWQKRCGYCYCLLADAPECADGCAHRNLSGHVGCARGGPR
jgi:histidine triad (HIT) family protein